MIQIEDMYNPNAKEISSIINAIETANSVLHDLNKIYVEKKYEIEDTKIKMVSEEAKIREETDFDELGLKLKDEKTNYVNAKLEKCRSEIMKLEKEKELIYKDINNKENEINHMETVLKLIKEGMQYQRALVENIQEN